MGMDRKYIVKRLITKLYFYGKTLRCFGARQNGREAILHATQLRLKGEGHGWPECLLTDCHVCSGSALRCALRFAHTSEFHNKSGDFKKAGGFTLIEAVMTLVLIAILAAIAYPSYRAIMQNIRVSSITNDFMATLSYARSEGLKRNQFISICPAADSTLTTCGGSTNWANGWIVFVDPDNNGVIAASSDRLKTHDALNAGSVISTTLPFITYNRSGFLAAGAGSFTITVPGCSGNSAQLITLSATGRASVTSTACTLP